ncbi:MAG: protein phosphatase 2C domain-containing protein [Sandaracinaceae bacterium]|nr:protein phosphatase 2C domain-containing protein [Sandaracinaceae bacterium]
MIATEGTPRGGRLVLGLGGCLLLLLAFGVVLVPDAARRLRERRDYRERASRMAIESRCGGRRSNEDRSAAFSVGEYDVLVAADGMGGHIGGARAASIVVASVQEYLEHRLALARDTELATDLVRSAFVRAPEALAAEDEEMGLGKRGVDALRSTLIVAVASPDTYIVGAQGDGGAWVQRGSGITIPLMTAAKGEAANIVTSSLGPTPEGSVDITKKRRMPRDVLVVCTDGVADRVGPEFDQAIRAHADEAADAREIVRPILDEFEKRPAVFDDNMTLGIVVTP